MEPIGIIFTGGPNSVYAGGRAARSTRPSSRWACPVLGICYGCQLMAHTLGGEVTAAHEDTAREYGKHARPITTPPARLFEGLPARGRLLDEPRRLYGARCPRASP